MRLFGPLYQRALTWSRHPKAPRLLFGLSLVEAIVFPVMPEVMLAPMCLAQPQRALRQRRVVERGAAVLDHRGHLRQPACRAHEQMGKVHRDGSLCHDGRC